MVDKAYPIHPTKADPKVSVIILNYNGRADLAACLSSLLEITYPKDKLEIIVVDNASTDGSVGIIQSEFPQVILIRNHANLGFSTAANIGADSATGDYLGFLNNDMRVDKNWLSALVETSCAGSEFACVGSKVLNWDGSSVDFNGRPDDAFCLAYNPLDSEASLSRTSIPYPAAFFVSGGASIFQRQVFQALGGFDPDFFLYHEDVDLCWRLWLGGYQCALASESIVYHKGGATSGKLPQEFIQKLSQKHTLVSIYKNLDDKNLREVLPLLLYFFLERGRWVPTAGRSFALAIREFQDSLGSVIEKRRVVQSTRVRTDAEIFALLGHPCNFLLRRTNYQYLRENLADAALDIVFDPNDLESARNAISEWLNRAHLLYESGLADELGRVIAENEQRFAEQSRLHETVLRERDEIVARLQGEVAVYQRTADRLHETAYKSQGELDQHRRELSEYQREIESLQAEVGARKEQADQLRSSVFELKQVAESLKKESNTAQLKNRQLVDELAEQKETANRLAALNESLRDEQKRNEHKLQMLTSRLADKESQLERITRSIGWRLLSRYGRVKYRYLLPVYRLLELMPYDKRSAPESNGAKPLLEEVDESLDQGTPDSHRAAAHSKIEDLNEVCESNAFDIVCFPIIGWDFRFQRPQQLMSRFASAGHRVFYLTLSFYSQGPAYTISEKGKNIYEVSLRGPARDVYADFLDDKARDALFTSLDALRRDFLLGASVAFVQLPFWWPLAEKTRADFAWPVVYDCMDYHAGFSTNKRTMVNQESDLLASADLVVVSSDALEKHALRENTKVLLVRNGCDYEHFSAAPVKKGKRPVVGYYGAIADWFDSDLVADLAQRRKDWDFVLVGSTFSADISRLSKLPNVSLPGEKHYSEIPDWLGTFDVVIIPFKRNALTEATNPVKGYEILASGKPLVSVPIPEMATLEPLVRLASTAEEFEREIIAALGESDPELSQNRRDFAKEHTWEKRYEILEPAVRAVFPKVSIIIVTFNNLALNRSCLESLYARTEWPNFEVIVVDNASADGTPEYLKEAEKTFPDLRAILNDSNLGFARANNIGLKEAAGDYLILLNNDTVSPRGWLSTLIRHLSADKKIGLIGPVTNEIGNEAKIPTGYSEVDDMPLWAANHVRENDNRLFAIPMLAMFCVGLRREVLEQVGLLDEDFEIGMFEDDDYTRRIREKGYKVVCAEDSFIHHFGRASFKMLTDERYREIFEKNCKTYEKKWGAWQPHKAR